MLNVAPSKLLTSRASYESWPVITRAANGAVIIAYAAGAAQHAAVDERRGVYVIQSLDNGVTWGNPSLVVDSETVDESTYGIGTTASGDVLIWVRTVVNPGLVFGNQLYRSKDNGATWTLDPALTFPFGQPVLIGPIVAAGNVLFSPYHAGPESGQVTRTWGHLRSIDDGTTWNQVQLGEAVDDPSWPVEPRYHVADDGHRILAIARHKGTGALWQYSSWDSGNTWTAPAATNITDGYETPTALVGADDDFTAIYFDRSAGILRARNTTFDTVFSAPQAWPSSVDIGRGTIYSQDNGYPHAIRIGGGFLCTWYSGMYNYPGIMALFVRSNRESAPGVYAGPRPTRIVDRIAVNPAGILTPVSGDISWSVPTSATSPTLVAYGLTPIADEVWNEGQLFWRLIGGGQVAATGDTLTISAHYYRDSGARVDPAQPQLVVTATTSDIKDSGWVALPTDFGHVASGFLQRRYRVDVRVKLNSGASGSARISASTVLLFGVR